MSLRSRVLVWLALLGALPAAAQTANVTPYPYTATLLKSATTAQTSAPVWVAKWPHVMIQVTVESGTCTTLSIPVTGSLNGVNYAPLPIIGGNTTVTQADVPVSSTRIWSVPAGLAYFQVGPTTASACTYSVYLSLSP